MKVVDLLVALSYEVEMTRVIVNMGKGINQYKEYTTYRLEKRNGGRQRKSPAEINAFLGSPGHLTPEGRISKLTIREARSMEKG